MNNMTIRKEKKINFNDLKEYSEINNVEVLT